MPINQEHETKQTELNASVQGLLLIGLV